MHGSELHARVADRQLLRRVDADQQNIVAAQFEGLTVAERDGLAGP
jgi:hypothetical protein